MGGVRARGDERDWRGSRIETWFRAGENMHRQRHSRAAFVSRSVATKRSPTSDSCVCDRATGKLLGLVSEHLVTNTRSSVPVFWGQVYAEHSRLTARISERNGRDLALDLSCQIAILRIYRQRSSHEHDPYR
jgi:hypothetical protein